MTRVGRPLVVALALLVAAACGDDGDATEDLGDGSTDTTVDEATVEEAVLEAHYAAFDAFDQASGNPVDPNHPALAESMVDPALSAAQDTLHRLAERSEYFDGPPIEHSATVTELGETRAVVEDCFTDRSAHYAADGSVISAGNPAPHHAEVIMVNEDGTWKRSEFNLGDPCEP